MGNHKLARSAGVPADVLVKQNGKAERWLLRGERRAERTLTEARARMHKAQMRLERRQSEVSDAEALLRTRQAARAVGPIGFDGTSEETLPPRTVTATDEAAQGGPPAEAESPSVKPHARRRTRKTAALKPRPS